MNPSSYNQSRPARTQFAADHAAAGSFQSAMSLLHRQLGAADFEPLRPYFLDLHVASHGVLPGVAGTPALLAHIDRWAAEALQRLDRAIDRR